MTVTAVLGAGIVLVAILVTLDVVVDVVAWVQGHLPRRWRRRV